VGNFFDEENKMKKVGLIVSTLVIFVFLAGYGFYASSAAETSKKAAGKDAATAKQEEATQKNAAMVNEKPITMAQYQAGIDQLDRQIKQTGRQPDEKEMQAFKKKVLDNLIEREVMRQEAEKRGIKADEAEVKAQVDAVNNSSTPYAMSLKQMYPTEPAMRNFWASQLAIKKMIDQDLGSKVTVTPEEMKAFYDSNPDVFKTPEMVRASHILVQVDQSASAEQKAKALEKIKGIQKRIQGGEDFAKVAKEVSDCPSKENGGDLNFFSKGDMVPQFDQVAFSMKPGDISDIVETQFGYHIIKVTDKRAAGTMPFDEVKPQIAEHLRTQKFTKEIPPYIEKFKSKAKIQILVKG
jgi:peptidyl-prolyl cis-trans isomerase C